MKNSISILGLKLFLITIILVFTAGCSSKKSVLGPGNGGGDSSSINDQLDEEFGGEDVSDILDDFGEQVKKDLEESEDGTNENPGSGL